MVLLLVLKRKCGRQLTSFGTTWRGADSITENKKQIEEYTKRAQELISQPGRERALEALDVSDKAITLDSNSGLAWFYKGQSLSRLDRRVEALECYERASTLNPNLPHSWHNQGICLQALGRYRDSIECFKKAIFVFSLGKDWKDEKKARESYASEEYEAMIRALNISYQSMYYLRISIDLLTKVQKAFLRLRLPLPEEIQKDIKRMELLHDSMRNIGTGMEGVDPPKSVANVDEKALQEATMLAWACKYEEAFSVFKQKIKPHADPYTRFFFATQLAESMPYRNIAALSAQELTPEKRRLRIEEAKVIFENVIDRIDKHEALAGMALNNQAASIVHLADYSHTWDDLLKKHREAYDIYKHATQTYPSLSWPRVNLAELHLCLRVLTEEAQKEPNFAENYIRKVGISPEKGVYLTDLRDVLLVARGDKVKQDLMSESNNK